MQYKMISSNPVRHFFFSRVGKIVLSLFMVFALYKVYGGYQKHVKRSHGFSLHKISSKFSHKKEWDSDVSKQELLEVNQILNQPFFFLGQGKQCYAFSSADGKYVMKFFQHERFKARKEALSFLPDCFLTKKLCRAKYKHKKSKRDALFQSTLLAAQLASQESGTIFIHLNKTKSAHGSVVVLDKKGKLLSIPLDDVQFVLQKKAKLVKPTLMLLMHQGKEEEAKERIDQIFDALLTTAQKGIIDKDGALIRNNNIGFLDDRAIFIDTGKLVYNDEGVSQKVFQHNLRRLTPLYKWLRKNYPTLGVYFAQKKEQVIASHDQD